MVESGGTRRFVGAARRTALGGSPICSYRRLRAWRVVLLALLIAALLHSPTARAQDGESTGDTLLITPTTQGIVLLPATGITLEVGYATVKVPAHLTVTRTESAAGTRYTVAAVDDYGDPLDRFEMPLIASLPPGDGPWPTTALATTSQALPAARATSAADPVAVVIGWPQTFTLAPAPPVDSVDAGRWLVVFDAHGIYAQPAWTAAPDSSVYLGPLEHYKPALIDHDLERGTLSYTISPPEQRAVLRTDTQNGEPVVTRLPTAAHAPRYADRFLPEDRGNPGGFALLGWTHADHLPDVVRALHATIPDDPNLPAPGVPHAPIRLILPFDCTQTWVISWGYHHSTPQNRFAVDFA
ncbi:MAG: hypothetical protein JXJ20_04070, partial [Anaerolineae bacterium]|nr:hypothetical protein [Anaerolineae bacterium]